MDWKNPIATILISTLSIIVSLNKPNKIVKSTNDILNLGVANDISLSLAVLIPIISSINLIMIYKYDIMFLMKRVMILVSIGSNLQMFNKFLNFVNYKNFLGIKNFKISITDTDLPSGFIEDIKYDEIFGEENLEKERNLKRWLKVNHFRVLSPSLERSGGLVFNVINIVSLCLSAILTYLYHNEKRWYLSNLIALGYIMNFINSVRLPNFKVSFVLLLGLLIYDVFFVFKTDVMVTVAKSVDLPIKLVFPMNDTFSIIGLGDIVLPGLFINLCYNHSRKYFIISVINYCISLAECFFVLNYYNFGQPALLYIVPHLLLSSVFTALVQGELSELFSYEMLKFDENFVYDEDSVDEIIEAQSEDEDEDDDYRLDSYDEWEFKVEDLDTDVDTLESIDDIIYQFGEDSDDGTFIIKSGSEMEESDIENDYGDEGEEEVGEDGGRKDDEDIETLLNDIQRSPRYRYI
ncbi:hypothetical protein CLIB1444_01S15544 [[Candida] jaroonii]|uniref:Uncharacterized protein n=1 Tax=[Candida] jaroonii TaxID=467808 RepID=A0ACA9Y1K3_9ASCO|nr:hypothetical protein CLIB1444_01S15544 [[Candida] jaroonii]